MQAVGDDFWRGSRAVRATIPRQIPVGWSRGPR